MTKKPGPPSLLSLLLAGVIMFSATIVFLLPNLVKPTRQSLVSENIYVSDTFKLSFSYPPGWSIRESPSEIDITQPDSKYALVIMSLENVPDTDKYISDLEQNDFFTVNPDSPIQIGGLKTLALIHTTDIHTQYMLYTPYKNEIIEAVFLSDNPQRTVIITRLLSTFKFTD